MDPLGLTEPTTNKRCDDHVRDGREDNREDQDIQVKLGDGSSETHRHGDRPDSDAAGGVREKVGLQIRVVRRGERWATEQTELGILSLLRLLRVRLLPRLKAPSAHKINIQFSTSTGGARPQRKNSLIADKHSPSWFKPPAATWKSSGMICDCLQFCISFTFFCDIGSPEVVPTCPAGSRRAKLAG